MTREIILGTILVLVAITAPSANAETYSYRWYAGASFGLTSFHHGVEDLSDGSISAAGIDDSDTGWKIFAGHQFSKHLSLELSYVDLNNDFDRETTLSGVSTGSGTQFAEGPISVDISEPRAAVAVLLGTLPLTKHAALVAKAGATSWRSDVTSEDRAGRSTRSESGIDTTYGAGLQYRATARIELRLEWERYANIVDADIDLVSLGLLVRLGRRGQ